MALFDLNETRKIYTRKDFYYDSRIKDGRFLQHLVDRNIGLADDDDYVILETRHEYRPYVLSFDLYAKDDYWWVFQRMNMDIILDPIRDFKVGLVIRVPKADRVRQFLG